MSGLVSTLLLASQVLTGCETVAFPLQAQLGLQQSQYRVVTPVLCAEASSGSTAEKRMLKERMVEVRLEVGDEECGGCGRTSVKLRVGLELELKLELEAIEELQ